jgi:hypothetical protein
MKKQPCPHSVNGLLKTLYDGIVNDDECTENTYSMWGRLTYWGRGEGLKYSKK